MSNLSLTSYDILKLVLQSTNVQRIGVKGQFGGLPESCHQVRCNKMPTTQFPKPAGRRGTEQINYVSDWQNLRKSDEIKAPRKAKPRRKNNLSWMYKKSHKSRQIPAPEKPGNEGIRTEFRRDQNRLVHAPSFRRLQGKTQLFPPNENEYFRNRLTHSLEVSQIARDIADYLNKTEVYFKGKSRNIDLDLIEFASLAHDIGHPPFGHNGEKALHQKMKDFGGFEGNAQSLRIITKIEKKDKVDKSNNSDEFRYGINPTARSILSILKYDNVIPQNCSDEVVKGYYNSEIDVVNFAKEKCGIDPNTSGVKTLECSIMDISDDIAYSTYDLEDSLKGNFAGIDKFLTISDGILSKITQKVRKNIFRTYGSKYDDYDFDENDTYDIIVSICRRIFDYEEDINDILKKTFEADPRESFLASYMLSQETTDLISNDGYMRTNFTSDLVGEFFKGIEFVEHEIPTLSNIRFKFETFLKVEVLKHYCYETVIASPRVRNIEFRGNQIVSSIFVCLFDDKNGGRDLLPNDWRDLVDYFSADKTKRARIICDFIAGMTDRYALEYYARLFSTNPMSIYQDF